MDVSLKLAEFSVGRFDYHQLPVFAIEALVLLPN
jgi:hypothetical protein